MTKPKKLPKEKALSDAVDAAFDQEVFESNSPTDIQAHNYHEFFEAYFRSIESQKLEAKEQDVFNLRLIQYFCACVFEGKSPPDWVLYFISKQFYNVLAGGHWHDEFPLPWLPTLPIRSDSEQLKLELYINVKRRLAVSKEENITPEKITSVVADEGNKLGRSASWASSAYFEMNKLIK